MDEEKANKGGKIFPKLILDTFRQFGMRVGEIFVAEGHLVSVGAHEIGEDVC